MTQKKQNNTLSKKILFELERALKNCGEDLLVEVMAKYGQIPDQDVISMLQEINTNFLPKIKNDEEEGQSIYGKWIDINGQMFDIKFLNSIKRVERYDPIKNKLIYGLLINEDSKEQTFYANSLINFESLNQRDIEAGKIKKKLEAFDIIFL